MMCELQETVLVMPFVMSLPAHIIVFGNCEEGMREQGGFFEK